MNGWIALALAGLGAALLLWRLGVARPLWSFVVAGLMLGAAGYVWQGRPSLPAAVARPGVLFAAPDPEVADLRLRMFGRFSAQQSFFVAADGMMRIGQADAAVRFLLSAVAQGPDNAANWTALGTALAQRDNDTLSPAARFAFARAIRLAPEHPGPPFFLGLACLRAGDFRCARGGWARALRLTPEGFSYRSDIAERLMLLDALLAMERGGARPPR